MFLSLSVGLSGWSSICLMIWAAGFSSLTVRSRRAKVKKLVRLPLIVDTLSNWFLIASAAIERLGQIHVGRTVSDT